MSVDRGARRRRPLSNFDDLYGLELESVGASEVRGRLEISDKVRQRYGLVHGGVYASIAETLATLGTIEGLEAGQQAVGLANNTSFLRPALSGSLHGAACARHDGRTTRVWDVEIRDDQGRLCAVTRMTVAIRPSERASP
jgi:1,4-dihydroxy-2-naphthoyl-CoA hydrolase